MINVNNAHVKEILKNVHFGMERKFESCSDKNYDLKFGNMLISLLAKNPDAAPKKLMIAMKEVYGMDVSVDEVIRALKKDMIGKPEERENLFKWARNMAMLLKKAILGDKNAFEEFCSTKSIIPEGAGVFRKCQERLLLITTYTILYELDVYNDYEKMLLLGNVTGRFCLYEIEDQIAKEYGFERKKKKKHKEEKAVEAEAEMSVEEAKRKISELQCAIERSDMMLKDLQDEFEEQLDECKIQELTEFFSKLNSDNYGRILDQLFVMRDGINRLRREHYELPREIDGLMILAVKLLQFVKDSHINPIMRVGTVMKVKAADIEGCQYEGSPFSNMDDVKTVKVTSPGWVFFDKDIQISRPYVKEEN